MLLMVVQSMHLLFHCNCQVVLKKLTHGHVIVKAKLKQLLTQSLSNDNMLSLKLTSFFKKPFLNENNKKRTKSSIKTNKT